MSSPQKDQLLATGHSPAGKFFLLDYYDYCVLLSVIKGT